jgi:hypothetical protein
MASHRQPALNIQEKSQSNFRAFQKSVSLWPLVKGVLILGNNKKKQNIKSIPAFLSKSGDLTFSRYNYHF